MALFGHRITATSPAFFIGDALVLNMPHKRLLLMVLLLQLSLPSYLLLQLLNLRLLLLQYILHRCSLLIQLPNFVLLLSLTAFQTVRQVTNLIFQVIDVGPDILFRCKEVGAVTTVATTTLLLRWWL